jgi:hypothetical protein
MENVVGASGGAREISEQMFRSRATRLLAGPLQDIGVLVLLGEAPASVLSKRLRLKPTRGVGVNVVSSLATHGFAAAWNLPPLPTAAIGPHDTRYWAHNKAITPTWCGCCIWPNCSRN